ncbi:hypothetical protein GGQ64_003039 [Rhizobium azooxidifex]|uniref:SPOR domain-containing protein n=1 Tax=Mycoplana azooxidifex TaxID=1636188 RepID=A0A7W6GJQ0_9HYPH|nr:SPOR domain-containing protein [Mycoplana azooxidifex]MBB3977825.1 hypothetical protein [Mycoplana azooxidifex]
MADKNLARSGPADADLLSDDDPLAELARIVGFEPRNVPTASRPVPPEPLQEPVFDLEDELLREFALYDAPALDPAGEFESVPEPVSVHRDETLEETFGEVIPAVEVVETHLPDLVEPSYEEETASIYAEEPVSVAGSDWQDEPAYAESEVDVALQSGLDVQPAYEGEQAVPAVEYPVEYSEEVAYEAPQADAPVTQAAAEYDDGPAGPTFLGLQPADYSASFDEPVALDLDQELELSLGEAFAETSEPSVVEPQEEAAPAHAWPPVESHAHHDVHAYDPAAAGYAVVDTGDAHAGMVQETFVEALSVVALQGAAEAAFASAPTYADPVPVTPSLGEGAHFEAEELPVEIGSVDFVPDWVSDPHADAAFAAAEEALSPHAAEALDAAVFEPPHSYEVAPPARAADGFDMDELLAEVERYPVPENRPPLAAPQAASLEAPRPRPGMLEGFSNVKFGRATPVAMARQSVAAPEPVAIPETAFAEPAAAEPLAVEPVVDVPVPFALDDDFAAPAASVAPAVESAAADIDDPFANFELDLSDIEFDLDASELMPSVPPEPPSAPAIAAMAAATVVPATSLAAPAVTEAEPAVPAQPPAPTPVAQTSVAPAPVVAAPADAPVVAVVPVVPHAEQASAPVSRTVSPVGETEQQELDFVLPFDPSLIADTDVGVAPVGELDVPHLPAVDKDKPPVHQPDYDLDIDAEMAQLFGEPAAAPASSRAAAVGAAANVVPFKPATGDAEEFDKALEEDLRRSLSQPERHAIPLDAQQVDDDDYVGDGYDEPARRGRGLMLAAAAATVVVLGGAGVYAFLAGTGAVGTGSGEPRVIAADKAPVKIVPDERGGQSVPNQDKAVYDRVAGKSDSGPQQEQLVTSTEEPVDVVQRTLTPESLPYDGPIEDDPAATAENAAADDERLLPGVDDQAAEQDAGEGNGPVVSPRKVRTMIVKPDGTLVAREEPVAPAETAPALAEATQPAAGAPTVSADAGLRAQPSDGAPASQDGDERALQELAGAAVEETAPVRTVTTTPVAATSVAATGLTAPDAAAAPAPQGEVPQGEVMVGTPVPVSRPAEQPVDVVGTVTERGRVTGTAPTETAALASEPVAQPAAAAPAQAEALAAAQPAAANPGGYVIQIASLPSEAEAQSSYNSLSSRFGSVIGGRGVDIKRAEIANKGTYYRVRIPAGSREEANALCAKYKAAGGSCLVTR